MGTNSQPTAAGQRIVFLDVLRGFALVGILFANIISWRDILYRLIHEVGQISLSLSYVCILAVLVNKIPGSRVFQWLKNYGRMSLTSYLGHTFFGILVFYPFFAWAYYGKFTLQTTFMIALVILVIQLLFSSMWFKYFKFGPVEWIWRCATYGKWFPLKK